MAADASTPGAAASAMATPGTPRKSGTFPPPVTTPKMSPPPASS